MIILLKKGISVNQAQELAIGNDAILLTQGEQQILVTSYSVKTLPDSIKAAADNYFVMDSDIQLASRNYLKQTRRIDLGSTYIGGDGANTAIIAGPCSVESEKQITQTANLLNQLNIKILRAGSFKPRTSPYTFQGMGLDGLKLLAETRRKHNLLIATEVRDATHADEVIEYADIVQIGAKSMYDHGILRKCSRIQKPIIFKRGFGSTLQEFVQCAEFILSGGNPNVILCERGIRTFETKTRFTLDLCGVAYLKEHTNLPIILDPSHAMGYSYGVSDLARASMAMGVDGLLIEVHPNPQMAKSDASQQLNHEQFKNLYDSLKPIAAAVGKKMI